MQPSESTVYFSDRQPAPQEGVELTFLLSKGADLGGANGFAVILNDNEGQLELHLLANNGLDLHWTELAKRQPRRQVGLDINLPPYKTALLAVDCRRDMTHVT